MPATRVRFFLHFSSRYSADFSKPRRAGLRHRINPSRSLGFGGRSCSVGIHRCREHCDKSAICDKQRWRRALYCGDVGSQPDSERRRLSNSPAHRKTRRLTFRSGGRLIPERTPLTSAVFPGPSLSCNSGQLSYSYSFLPFPCGFPPPTQTSPKSFDLARICQEFRPATP